MSQSDNRPFFLSLLRDLQSDKRVTIVPPTEDLFQRGLDLYEHRMDKDWSLTDCISFLVMGDRSLTDAAALDHHFSQAGFNMVIPRARRSGRGCRFTLDLPATLPQEVTETIEQKGEG